jgi:hypothetical protein
MHSEAGNIPSTLLLIGQAVSKFVAAGSFADFSDIRKTQPPHYD